jgi:hypothetical protein
VERGLIFSLWIQASKDPVALRLALEALAAGQANTFTNGGKVMVSASVAGKSFSYQLQPGINPMAITELALGAWKSVKDFTTSAEIENFLTKSNGNVSYPNFGIMLPINP